MRYFFHVGFNGFNYQGWQKLPGIKSVQQVIESCLEQVLKTPVSVVGCGRTDAQVNASQFFFHLDMDVDPEANLLFKLNKNLPSDIAIFDIIPMDNSVHARFDATKRTYDYFIHNFKDPFLSNRSFLYEGNLDVDKMRTAMTVVVSCKDFRSLCKNPGKHRTTICEMSGGSLVVDHDGNQIRFTFSANRFLRGMIRIVVQKLLDVGGGKLSVEELEECLTQGKSFKTIDHVPAHGLYLSKVTYPFLDIAPRPGFLSMRPRDFKESKNS